MHVNQAHHQNLNVDVRNHDVRIGDGVLDHGGMLHNRSCNESRLAEVHSEHTATATTWIDAESCINESVNEDVLTPGSCTMIGKSSVLHAVEPHNYGTSAMNGMSKGHQQEHTTTASAITSTSQRAWQQTGVDEMLQAVPCDCMVRHAALARSRTWAGGGKLLGGFGSSARPEPKWPHAKGTHEYRNTTRTSMPPAPTRDPIYDYNSA